MSDRTWNDDLKAEAVEMIKGWDVYVDDRQALGDLLDLLGLDDVESQPYTPSNPCASCGQEIHLTDTVDVTILRDGRHVQTHVGCLAPTYPRPDLP